MQLQKTDKARAELQSGIRTLGQRERALLILADGKTTVGAVDHLFNGQAQHMAQQLIAAGYLVGIDLEPARTRAPKIQVPEQPPAPVAAPEAEAAPDTLRPHAVDNFAGKRSMASTRMFLFDICERMFVRRDPVLAESFREALRDAKDRESMLAAADAMVAAVQAVAGEERASSIRERMALLLPPED